MENRIKISGKFEIKDTQPGTCVHTLEGEAEVGIMGFGGAIAGMIVDQIKAGFEKMPGVVEAYKEQVLEPKKRKEREEREREDKERAAKAAAEAAASEAAASAAASAAAAAAAAATQPKPQQPQPQPVPLSVGEDDFFDAEDDEESFFAQPPPPPPTLPLPPGPASVATQTSAADVSSSEAEAVMGTIRHAVSLLSGKDAQEAFLLRVKAELSGLCDLLGILEKMDTAPQEASEAGDPEDSPASASAAAFAATAAISRKSEEDEDELFEEEDEEFLLDPDMSMPPALAPATPAQRASRRTPTTSSATASGRLGEMDKGVLSVIFYHAGLHSAPAIAQVNAHWHSALRDEQLWRRWMADAYPPYLAGRYPEDLSPPGDHAQRLVTAGARALIKRRALIESNWRSGVFSPSLVSCSTPPVNCAQFDAKRIILGTDDNIHILDLATMEVIKMLRGHNAAVTCLHFHGDRLVSGSTGKALRVWDLESGRCTHALQGHSDGVRCVVQDGVRIVSGSEDCSVKVWDLATGRCERTLLGHSGAVLCVALGGSGPGVVPGAVIVSGSQDTTFKAWDAASGRCTGTFFGHTAPVTAIEIEVAHGSVGTVVSASEAGEVKGWDLNTGACLWSVSWPQSGAVRCLQFDRTKVVAGCNDGCVRILARPTAQEIETHSSSSSSTVYTPVLLQTIASHKSKVVALQFATDRLVSVSKNALHLLNFRAYRGSGKIQDKATKTSKGSEKKPKGFLRNQGAMLMGTLRALVSSGLEA
jgi:hypothetical protein